MYYERQCCICHKWKQINACKLSFKTNEKKSNLFIYYVVKMYEMISIVLSMMICASLNIILFVLHWISLIWAILLFWYRLCDKTLIERSEFTLLRKIFFIFTTQQFSGIQMNYIIRTRSIFSNSCQKHFSTFFFLLKLTDWLADLTGLFSRVIFTDINSHYNLLKVNL